MSRCISRAGEYGDHVLADTGTAVERFVCSRCFVAAEDELFAEVDSLRAELAAERAKVGRVAVIRAEWGERKPDEPCHDLYVALGRALAGGDQGE